LNTDARLHATGSREGLKANLSVRASTMYHSMGPLKDGDGKHFVGALRCWQVFSCIRGRHKYLQD